MNYIALSATVADYGGAFSPERLALAGQMTLIGMGMIFAVLSILWGVLAIFKLVFARPEPKKAKQVAEVKPDLAAVAEPEPVVAEQNDDELIAVITVAIAAYIADEEPNAYQSGFRVVSFRRANGGKAWNSK